MDPMAQALSNELHGSLLRIKSLVEWVKLKQVENRSLSPFDWVQDDSAGDLLMETLRFLAGLQTLEGYARQDAEIRIQWRQMKQEFLWLNLPIPL